MRVFLVALLGLVCYADAELLIEPHTLVGTERDLARGMSDKLLGIQNYLFSLFASAKTTPPDQPFPYPLFNNVTGNADRQTDMTSLRYSLAFSAYYVAANVLVNTPAYPSPSLAALSDIFDLLLDERVYNYWHHKGVCAPFFLEPICTSHNLSMCDLDQLQQPSMSLNCEAGDPVSFGNIMYSAHVAHVGSLLALLGGPQDRSFTLGGTDYTLASLLSELQTQANAKAPTYGITCEPTNMFPAYVKQSDEAKRTNNPILSLCRDTHGRPKRRAQY